MNRPPRNLHASRPIDIGIEKDFSLGGLSVHPSTREIGVDGRRESVEPRVMQVLVALMRADGVLSRDRLIEQCWGGRLVGDDAINSSIAKVRALAALTVPAAFEIETIPRVGYRLRTRKVDKKAVAAGPLVAALAKSLVSRQGIVWILAAFAASVIAAGSSYFYMAQPREWTVTESHLSFISTPLLERWPAFSPDGTMLAYSAGPSVNSRKIFLRLLRGGDPIQLTHDDADASSPVFSPDGSSIAYLLSVPGRPCRVMLVPVPAGASRQIGSCQYAERSFVSWDHDGRALFLSDSNAPDTPQHVYRLDSDSGTLREFVHPPSPDMEDSQPLLSPDGKTLLLVRSTTFSTREVVLHPLSGGPERVLMTSADFGTSAAWSNDSSTVFVAKLNVWDSALWGYPVSGARPYRIMTSPAGMDALAAGPDGLIAMDLQNFGSELAVAPTAPDDYPRVLDAKGLKIDSADYARDGALVMAASQSGAFALWIEEPDQALRRLIPLNVEGAGDPRWSPDGSRIAYVEVSGGKLSIRVLTRSGTPVADIPVPGLEASPPDWTSDGKAIVMPRRDQNGWRLWRTDIAQPNVSIPITPYGWEAVRIRDNMMFALKSETGGIWRIDGMPRKLTEGPTQDGLEAWTVTKDRVVYPDFADPDHPRLLCVPFTGGRPRGCGYPKGMRADSFLIADPVSGHFAYALQTHLDSDIGWIRVSRR